MPWLYCGRRYPSCLAVRVVAFFTYDRRVKEGRPSNRGRRWGVMVPGAAWFGYRRLMAGWARRVSSCFTCYLGGACRVVGVCDHMGFSPLTPFCLRVAGKNGALLLFLWVGRGHKRRRRGGLSCVGVGCFESLMLRYGDMSAPRVLMGCQKRIPCRVSWG